MSLLMYWNLHWYKSPWSI